MKLTKAQRRAIEVLRLRGTAARNGAKTMLDPPTIHAITEGSLWHLGLIDEVPMIRHCETCDCSSDKVQLTALGQMVANQAQP